MKRHRLILLSLLAVGLGTVGCDGDKEPTAPADVIELSEQDQEALVSSLRNSAGQGGFAAFELVIPQLESAGTITIDGVEYAAVGMQLDLEITDGDQTLAIEWTGLLAWTGLDGAAGTVDEIIHIIASGLLDAGDVAELGGFDPQAPFDGIAVVFQPPSQAIYISSEGTFAVTGVAFGAEEPCPNIESADTECAIAIGTMAGSFDFTANALSTEGSLMRSADFDVPAVRIRAVARVVPGMSAEH